MGPVLCQNLDLGLSVVPAQAGMTEPENQGLTEHQGIVKP